MSGKEDADLSATVLQQIIHLILYKELQPGEAISQRSIAHRLGVSTQPVAIAFKQLEADGLIAAKNRCGTHVALLTPAEAWDSMQLRLAVEERAIELVCANAPDEAISMLLPLAEDADRLDRESFMLEADDRFHLALCEKAMSPALFCFLKKKMSVFRAKPFLCPALTQLAESLQPHGEPGSQAEIRGHVALFESIRRRDVLKARKMMEEHVCVRGVSALVEHFSRRMKL